MLISKTITVIKEQCPKCKAEFQPRQSSKERNYLRCPKCKHVYDNDSKK